MVYNNTHEKRYSAQIPPKSIVRVVAFIVFLIGVLIILIGALNLSALGLVMGGLTIIMGVAAATTSVIAFITGDPEWILLQYFFMPW